MRFCYLRYAIILREFLQPYDGNVSAVVRADINEENVAQDAANSGGADIVPSEHLLLRGSSILVKPWVNAARLRKSSKLLLKAAFVSPKVSMVNAVSSLSNSEKIDFFA